QCSGPSSTLLNIFEPHLSDHSPDQASRFKASTLGALSFANNSGELLWLGFFSFFLFPFSFFLFPFSFFLFPFSFFSFTALQAERFRSCADTRRAARNGRRRARLQGC